jgi:hypothetical protein
MGNLAESGESVHPSDLLRKVGTDGFVPSLHALTTRPSTVSYLAEFEGRPRQCLSASLLKITASGPLLRCAAAQLESRKMQPYRRGRSLNVVVFSVPLNAPNLRIALAPLRSSHFATARALFPSQTRISGEPRHLLTWRV